MRQRLIDALAAHYEASYERQLQRLARRGERPEALLRSADGRPHPNPGAQAYAREKVRFWAWLVWL